MRVRVRVQAMATKAYELSRLLEVLPPVNFAVAYGSGVFKHFGSAAVSTTTKVVDYILAVDNAQQWHAENAAANPRHYGGLSKLIGGKSTAILADTVGLGVHFNPYVQVGGQLCKYGVVSTASLLRDLDSWEHLYLAGRLHKPVKGLVKCHTVERAMSKNLRSALCAALLLLPEKFSKEELYYQICSLSYRGDIRMAFAEDKSKVENIVGGSERELDHLYLQDLHGVSGAKAGLVIAEGTIWSQAKNSVSSRAELLTSLPDSVLAEMGEKSSLSFRNSSLDIGLRNPMSRLSFAVRLAQNSDHINLLQDALSSRVRLASFRQALHGVLTTGLGKSSYYLFEKVRKALMTRR